MKITDLLRFHVYNNFDLFSNQQTDERQFQNATHLIMYSVDHNDSGQYACVSVNEFGSNSRSAWILVSDPVRSSDLIHVTLNVTLGKYLITSLKHTY